MNGKVAAFLLVLASPFVCAAPSLAQAGVPDLSEFTDAVSKDVAAPTVKPGETARGIGKRVGATREKYTGPNPESTQLEESMPRWLTAMEGALGKSGYAKRDMGVAYSFAFLELYKNATGKTVPEDAYQTAFHSLATAITRQWGPKYAALTPANKEKIYESLLMDTALNTEFTNQLEAAGKTEDAKSFRRASAMLFKHLVSVPPAQVTIAANGAITGLAPNKSEPVKP